MSFFVRGETEESVIYEEQFQLAYHTGSDLTAMDDMPAADRKVFYRLLVEQNRKEKEAQEEAQEGEKGPSLLRKPVQGEVYGKTDLEKQTTPRYAARFEKGQQLRAQYEAQKQQASQEGRRK